MRYTRFSNPHTYEDLINHKEEVVNDPDGDVLYGLDVFIDPDYQGYRLGRRLYDARKDLCRNHNYRGILAGGRIPRYHEYVGTLTPTQYIEKVSRREIYDPILTFQLANDFQVKRLLRKYLPQDEKSAGYATLLEWHNILYDTEESVVLGRKSVVRVGVVQSQMRTVKSPEELLAQVEYFVDAVSDYSSDFVIFPEFFTAPLMGLKNAKTAMTPCAFSLSSPSDFFMKCRIWRFLTISTSLLARCRCWKMIVFIMWPIYAAATVLWTSREKFTSPRRSGITGSLKGAMSCASLIRMRAESAF